MPLSGPGPPKRHPEGRNAVFWLWYSVVLRQDSLRFLRGFLLRLGGSTAQQCDAVALKQVRCSLRIGGRMVDRNFVAGVEQDRGKVRRSRDGIEDLLSLQPQEEAGGAVEDGAADFGDTSLRAGFGALLRLGDALVGEQADILLFAGGYGRPEMCIRDSFRGYNLPKSML